MKKLILFFTFLLFLTGANLKAQKTYYDSIPSTCSPVSGGMVSVSHTNAFPNAITGATLTIYYNGDGALSSEYIDVLDESGTIVNTLYFSSQCSGTFDVSTSNFTQAQIANWAADGQIDFTYDASSAVDAICSGNSFCVTAALTYDYQQFADDIGVSKLDSPTIFCTPNQDIWATVTNYGTTQVDTFSVGWEVNGVAQTPQTFYTLLDTLGGTGNSTTMIQLGNVSITNTDTLKMWTYNPNNSTDGNTNNDTLESIISPSLSGTYTIGGASPDYANFSAAVADLNNYGVCGPVVFDVAGTTFNEQITLTPVTGVSATNTITFRGTTGSELTSAVSTSTSNYTVFLDGADYITFDSLTISNTDLSYMRVFEIGNGAENNVISNCVLYNDTTPTSSSTYDALVYSPDGLDHNNTFRNNLFHGGSYGLYLDGDGSGTSLEQGTLVENNEFKNQYYTAVRFYYQKSPQLINNYIHSNASYTSADAIYISYCDSGVVVAENVVESSVGGNWPDNGIYMRYSDASADNPSLIYNNMIQVGDTFQGSARYGAYLYYVDYMKFYNNSLNALGSSTSNRALYQYYGDYHTFYNNNFAAYGGGYAAYFTSTSTMVDSANYNNFHATSTNPIYYGGATSLSNYQTASGRDTNSVSYDPMYFAFNDLHSCQNEIRDKGIIYNGLNVDIDGQTRNTNASIGADEFFAATPGFLGPDIEKCPADTVTLGAENAVGTFMWNTGSSSSSLTTSNAGTYYLQASTYCGSGTDTIEVTNLSTDASWGISQQSYLTVVFDGPSGFDTYKWYFGDGDTANVEDPLHIYPTIGTYTVTLIATNKCGTYTSSDPVTVTNVGMEDLKSGASVKVYPNPSNGTFSVDLNNFEGEDAELRVVDIQGKTVFSKQYHIANDVMREQINLNTANAGIYYLKVISESGTTVRKIVVE